MIVPLFCGRHIFTLLCQNLSWVIAVLNYASFSRKFSSHVDQLCYPLCLQIFTTSHHFLCISHHCTSSYEFYTIGSNGHLKLLNVFSLSIFPESGSSLYLSGYFLSSLQAYPPLASSEILQFFWMPSYGSLPFSH